MIFEPVLDLIPEWRRLGPDLNARLSTKGHGDYPRWEAALAALPDLQAEQAALSDRVTVSGNASEDQRRDLRESLMALHPWRKGPFSLFEVDIDCEWRSDWKWLRVLPHLDTLSGRRVLDVGCGNGDCCWRMLEAGATAVFGVDPTLVFCMQHLAVSRYLSGAANWVLPLRFEQLPPHPFDTVFSMGVIYHRRDPAEHARRLAEFTRPGGQVVVESLVVEHGRSLKPVGRYARMRNVHVVPTTKRLARWLKDAGFVDPELVDLTPTTVAEQRATTWMRFESLEDALDPKMRNRTIEGHPAPVRAVMVARKPV
jgi:tRNA (mo5U34)-methyltransferase